MKQVEFSGSSPVAGWEPMVEWLRSEGFVPEKVAALAVDLDTLDAKVTEHLYRDGKKYVDSTGEHLAAETRQVKLRTSPPLHPARSAA